ncbi:hypothetical protein P0Y67_21645 (plasmid) [Photobacterium sp. SP02]|uniref:hypothetical protein n=2 Tax=Pseudomonadota TaxID=1224 RepID=UPI00314516CB
MFQFVNYFVIIKKVIFACSERNNFSSMSFFSFTISLIAALFFAVLLSEFNLSGIKLNDKSLGWSDVGVWLGSLFTFGTLAYSIYFNKRTREILDSEQKKKDYFDHLKEFNMVIDSIESKGVYRFHSRLDTYRSLFPNNTSKGLSQTWEPTFLCVQLHHYNNEIVSRVSEINNGVDDRESFISLLTLICHMYDYMKFLGLSKVYKGDGDGDASIRKVTITNINSLNSDLNFLVNTFLTLKGFAAEAKYNSSDFNAVHYVLLMPTVYRLISKNKVEMTDSFTPHFRISTDTINLIDLHYICSTLLSVNFSHKVKNLVNYSNHGLQLLPDSKTDCSKLDSYFDEVKVIILNVIFKSSDIDYYLLKSILKDCYCSDESM